MADLLHTRATLIWLLLIAATIVSWEVGHDALYPHGRFGAAFVVLIAFIKVRFVILDFMEIRRAPLPLRIVAEIWAVLLCSLLVTLLLWGPSLLTK